MKKLLLLTIAIFAISCSDDDSSTTASADDALGKWKPITVTFQGQTSDINYPCPQNGILWLKNEGVLVEYSSMGTNCDIDTFTYGYSIEGNVFTLTEDNYTTKAHVLQASETSLKLEYFYDSDTGDYTDDQKEIILYQKVE